MRSSRVRSTHATVHAIDDSARFAQRLARGLDAPFAPVRTHFFPDGETLVRVTHRAGTEAILVQSFNDPDRKLMPALQAADALRRAGARRVTLVAPYLAYMRQDRVFRPGEPISQSVFGGCLGHAFDRVLTVEAHLHRIHRLGDVIAGRARSLSAGPAIARWLAHRASGAIAVGPDEESEPWVRAVARTAGVRWMVGVKRRLSDRSVRIRFGEFPRGARAVVIDDIASSGATIAAAVRALRAGGVGTVDAVVHAIFAPGALDLIRLAGARSVVSCDTVTHPTNRIECAPLVVAALGSAR
jgi:ribose-phosphate pyrophosphokinase